MVSYTNATHSKLRYVRVGVVGRQHCVRQLRGRRGKGGGRGEREERGGREKREARESSAHRGLTVATPVLTMATPDAGACSVVCDYVPFHQIFFVFSQL